MMMSCNLVSTLMCTQIAPGNDAHGEKLQQNIIINKRYENLVPHFGWTANIWCGNEFFFRELEINFVYI